jgi:hypothetical protein
MLLRLCHVFNSDLVGSLYHSIDKESCMPGRGILGGVELTQRTLAKVSRPAINSDFTKA